jgi:hypothetical protein
MTISIEHSVNFVTEFDEAHPTTQRLINSVENPSKFLADMLAEMLVSEGFIAKFNEGGSWAILKVVR